MNVRLRRSNTRSPSIPVSSTGDIAFLVIIFFMTTSVFSQDKGLKVVLPPPQTDSIHIPTANLLTVLVGPDGRVLVDGSEPKTIDELGAIARERLAENPKLSVALRVSRQARYSSMIEAFDELRTAGATRLSLVPVLPAGEAGGR